MGTVGREMEGDRHNKLDNLREMQRSRNEHSIVPCWLAQSKEQNGGIEVDERSVLSLVFCAVRSVCDWRAEKMLAGRPAFLSCVTP